MLVPGISTLYHKAAEIGNISPLSGFILYGMFLLTMVLVIAFPLTVGLRDSDVLRRRRVVGDAQHDSFRTVLTPFSLSRPHAPAGGCGSCEYRRHPHTGAYGASAAEMRVRPVTRPRDTGTRRISAWSGHPGFRKKCRSVGSPHKPCGFLADRWRVACGWTSRVLPVAGNAGGPDTGSTGT